MGAGSPGMTKKTRYVKSVATKKRKTAQRRRRTRKLPIRSPGRPVREGLVAHERAPSVVRVDRRDVVGARLPCRGDVVGEEPGVDRSRHPDDPRVDDAAVA